MCFKWCFILPTSHIPLADNIIIGSFNSFKAFDSSAVFVNLSPGNSNGLSPFSISSLTSSSNKSIFSLNISVAETASGLSTKTGAFIILSYFALNSSSSVFSFILFSSYNISWVLPTANEGITTVPFFSKVS